MILDSTFIHDLVRKEQVAIDELEALIDAGTRVALSAIIVFEVGVGLRGPGAQYRGEFDAVVADLDVVPLDSAAAHCALEVQRDLYDQGKAIGARDVLIAGTALDRGEDVLTRNVGEFERVEGITVETY